MKIKSSKKFAFTVAEILLAVTILGIIFLLSVNTLQTSSADRESSSQLMKLYPVMDNMISLIVLENMGSDNIPFGESDGNGDKFSQMLAKRLRVGEDCQNSGATTCWADTSNMPENINNDFYRLKLVDGTGLAVKTFEDCSGEVTNFYTNVCMIMYVDVNALDKPNKWEEDVYRFVYNKEYTDGDKIIEEGFHPASERTKQIIEKPKESIR